MSFLKVSQIFSLLQHPSLGTCSRGVDGEGALSKISYGLTPYPFIYHFLQRRDTFYMPFAAKWYPFHILVQNTAPPVNAPSFNPYPLIYLKAGTEPSCIGHYREYPPFLGTYSNKLGIHMNYIRCLPLRSEDLPFFLAALGVLSIIFKRESHTVSLPSVLT